MMSTQSIKANSTSPRELQAVMKAVFFLFFLLSFLARRETLGVELSSFLEPCSQKDPNLNECVKAAGQKLIPQISEGVAEWNIPSIDPITTSELSFTDRSGDNDLVITYKNIVQTGFSKIQVDTTDVDLEHRVMNFKLKYPLITFSADYVSSGRFFGFDVQGNGKANITVWNAFSSLGIKYHIAKDHIKTDSVTVGFSFDKIFLDYSHLMLNGDEELSKSAGKFINENSKEIIDSFKPELDRFYAKMIGDVLDALFDAIPYSVLFKKN